MLEVLGLLLIAPFLMWREASPGFRALGLLEQDLQRATRGAALLTLGLLVLFGLHGAHGFSGFLPALVADPGDTWVGAIVLAGVLIYGGHCCVAGVRSCWGRTDGWRATRAFSRFALGVGGLWLLWTGSMIQASASDPRFAFAWLLLNLVALCCTVTGAVRFLLLTVSGRLRVQERPRPRAGGGSP
jgi:hypothetical protein